MCIYIHVYTYIFMYICVHTHTYAYTVSFGNRGKGGFKGGINWAQDKHFLCSISVQNTLILLSLVRPDVMKVAILETTKFICACVGEGLQVGKQRHSEIIGFS